MTEHDNPEDMTDEELAEEYKSYFLQMENDLPRFWDEETYFRKLKGEIESREHLEVMQSVRIIDTTEEDNRESVLAD